MMTPGAEQGGAKKMKGLAKNQHKTSELGLEAPSTKKEDSDKKMQGEWNKVMDGIGSNAGKGMYIPAGTDFMQKKPAPHNPTIMGESPPSTFFPHGIHASHRHAAGIEQGPALPVPDSGKNWFTWAAAGPADAKSAAPSSFSSQSEARIDHDQGRADRGAVRQGSSSVLSTQPTPPSISMNIEDSQLHLGTPSDVRSDKGQVGEEKRRNTKAEVTKDEDKMHPAERMQVTVPTGLKGGQLLRVETPQGLMQVTIPAGLKAGQLFELILPPTGKKEGEAGAAEAPTRASLSRAGDASGIQSAKNVHEPLLRHNKAPAGEEASEAAVAVEGMAARDLAKDLRNKMPRTRFYEDAMRMAAKDLVRDLHAKLANSVSAKGPASQAYKDAMRMVVTDLSGDLHAGTPRANQEHDAMSPIEEHANQEHDANQEHANQEHDAMSPIEEHDAMSPDRLAAHLLAHHHANADKQEAYSPRTGELRDDEQGGASVEGVGETGKNNAKARQRTDKKVQINEEHSGHAGVLGVYTQASSPDRPASSSDDVMQRKDEKMQVDQAREDAAARDLARRRISAAATSEADEGPAAAAAASAPTEAEAEGSGVRARLRSSEPADTKGNPSASVATVYGATEVQPEQGKEENGDASEKGDATAGMPPGTLKLVFMLVGTNKRLMTSAQIDAFKTQASLYASEKSPQGERLLPPLVTTPVLADVAGLDSAVSLTVHVTPLAKETCATPLEQLSKWTIPDESLLPLSPIQDSGPPTLHLIAVEGCPQFTNLKAPRTSKAPQHALSAHSIMMRHMQRQELQLEAKMAAYEAKEHATIEREHHLEHELAHERLAEHSARAAATLNTLKQLPRSPHAHAKQMHQVLHAAAPSSNLTRDASATAPLAKVHTGSASTATAKVPNPSATTSPDLTQNVAQWLGVKAAARTASPARTPHALESAKQLWASAKAAALKRQAKNRKQEHEMVMKKLAEVEKDYARVSSQMAKEHPAEDSTSGELQDAEQDVEAYRHASASAEGSDAKEDAGYVPPGSLRAAATGKGAVQPSLQAASAHVGGKASLATRSMPHVPVTGTRGTTTLSYMHQKQALDAVSEDENMKQLWDLVDGKVAPAAQAPPWKAGDAMETGEQATIRSAEEHTADAAHDDHPATTAAFITGKQAVPKPVDHTLHIVLEKHTLRTEEQHATDAP
jgi:hypothetical protein